MEYKDIAKVLRRTKASVNSQIKKYRLVTHKSLWKKGCEIGKEYWFKKGNKSSNPYPKGHVPHNKGKTKKDYKPLEEVSKKLKDNNPMKNKQTSEIVRKKNIEFYKNPLNRKKASIRFKRLYKEGKLIPPNLGKKPSKNTRNKMSKSRIGKYCLENHPNWLGGKSFEPYGLEFNKKLKEFIRNKFGRKCVECGYSEKQLGYTLHVHHLDYNKKNNSEENLIPLCRSCHTQTNFKRDDWTDYFKRGRK